MSQPPELSVAQLSVLLFALCNGVPQAAHRFRLAPVTLRQLMDQRHHNLARLSWHWKTDSAAAWVLSQREQQLLLQEMALLQTARRALGENSELVDQYGWAVDFMLRHHLSLQPISNMHQRNLPRDIRAHSMAAIRSLCNKVSSRSLRSQHMTPNVRLT